MKREVKIITIATLLTGTNLEIEAWKMETDQAKNELAQAIKNGFDIISEIPTASESFSSITYIVKREGKIGKETLVEMGRVLVAWDEAEKHGKLPDPNPHGVAIGVTRNNQVIQEMRGIFHQVLERKK